MGVVASEKMVTLSCGISKAVATNEAASFLVEIRFGILDRRNTLRVQSDPPIFRDKIDGA